jgi:hypothetical protein
MNRKQFTQYIKENIKEILSEAVAVEFTGKTGKKSLQSVPNIGAANSLKAQNPNIASVTQLEEMSLNEMAKIAGALDAAIRKVIEDNPDLEGLPLKKAIKGSEKVKDALDTDELYDNQLNKFIALVKGQRELGKKGRKPLEKADEPKKEAPKKEAPKKVAPKKEKKAKDEDEDEEVEDNWNKSSDDDAMEDEKNIDKKAQAAAKKGGSNLTKLNRAISQVKELEKEMKEIANDYKKAEGSKKETLLSQLKEKTKAKKELEKLQDKLAADVV